MEVSESHARAIRDKSKKEFDALVSRITTLQTQYQQIQGSLKNTLKRGKRIESIKEIHHETLSKRTEQITGHQSLLQKRKLDVEKQQQHLRQSLVRAREELKDVRYADTQRIKQLSDMNHQRIEEMKLKEIMDVMRRKDNVVIQEELGRQKLQHYWEQRMDKFDQAHQSRKQDYLHQSQYISQQTAQLERVEANLLIKLKESQQQQHQAADNLRVLYTSYYEHMTPKPNLEVVPQPSRKPKGTQSLSKLFMYDQPLTLLNNNVKLSVRGLPKYRKKLPFLAPLSKTESNPKQFFEATETPIPTTHQPQTNTELGPEVENSNDPTQQPKEVDGYSDQEKDADKEGQHAAKAENENDDQNYEEDHEEEHQADQDEAD